MEENRLQEENLIEIDGLTEAEAEKIRELWERFLKAYKESGEEQKEFEWLKCQLQEELPDKTEEEIQAIKEEIVESIREYDSDLQDMTENIEKGRTKERWFADRLEDAAKGVAVNDYGNYLEQINTTMDEANRQMMRTVLRQDGEVSECLNLDGFIAEQYHVNNFNAKAALQNSPFRAEVCTPGPGETYGKNSFDVRIWNTETKQIVHQYQFKFGKDAKATIELLKKGVYANQRYLVPAEQVMEVQEAFPTKTVTDHLGGTEKVDVISEALSKKQVKELQTEVQETGQVPKTGWNIYNTKELAINLGKQAGAAGVQAALLASGIRLAGKAIRGEKIDGGEVVETALETGADAGIKAAAGGALTVASQKGVLPILPPGTAVGSIAKIACVGIENIKIMWRVVKGELTTSEALEHMGRTSAAMVVGMSCVAFGMTAGAATFGFIPIVGPIVGGLIGGMAGYTVGSKFGETIFNGAKKIAERGKEVAVRTWESIKSIGGRIKEGFFSIFS